MSFLLCCLLGQKDVYDINKNNIQKKQNRTLSSNNIDIITDIDTSHNNNVKNDRTDELITITDFDRCKFWFSEILKQTINYEEYGNNKKELYDYIWNNIEINNILKYYRRYNKKYNLVNNNNIKQFIENKENEDFIYLINMNHNIYRFH